MSLPKVTVLYANGNLLADIAALDGVAAIIGTGSTPGLLGVPMSVVNLDDAIEQGITEVAEPVMYRHLSEFYGELGGNQQLFIMLVEDTMTQEDMVDNVNANSAKKLTTFAEGKIRLLGSFYTPGVGYNGGADFIDSDVAAAIIKAKVFAQARLGELSPLRIILEARVQNPNAANTLTPKNSQNGFTGVLLGGTANNGSASIGLLLGRLVKYGAEIKAGKVANGALNANQIYIGNKALKDVANLEALHEAGFISFMKHPQKAGFFFGIDRMCSIDDYRLLAFGRVVDKAAVIAAATYAEEIEGEVEVEANGNLASHIITYLERKIEQQINVAMASQISGVQVYIKPDQNTINTSKTAIKVRVQPKGYLSFIEVELGIVSQLS